MSRRLLTACAVLALLAAIAEVSPASAADIVIKAGHSAAATEPYQVGFEYFKKRVEELTKGKVEVQLFPNRTLGNERDMIEGLLLGTVHITVPSNAVMAGFVPETKVLDLPFLFRDRQHMYGVIDGPVGADLGERMRAKGFRLLSYYEAGVRHIMTNRKSLDEARRPQGPQDPHHGEPRPPRRLPGHGREPVADGLWRGVHGAPAGRHRRRRGRQHELRGARSSTRSRRTGRWWRGPRSSPT